MDDYLTRHEHEEFRKTINAEHERLKEEDVRQNHRLESLEKEQEQISSLVASVQKLAVNMENMLREQERQGVRLEKLEGRDGEKWRQVTGYVVTTIIGIILGLVATHLGL